MRRLAAAAAIPVLVGLPLSVDTSWMVGLVAAASGTFCILAVRRASLQLATTGGTLAVIALTLALRSSSSSPHMLVAALFGLALLLLVDGVHLLGCLDGAAIARAWWRRHLAWWSARAAISLGIAIVIAALAPLIAIALPHLWGPFVAGFGVLAAFAAALALAWPRADE
jgi:hypothetical protein